MIFLIILNLLRKELIIEKRKEIYQKWDHLYFKKKVNIMFTIKRFFGGYYVISPTGLYSQFFQNLETANNFIVTANQLQYN